MIELLLVAAILCLLAAAFAPSAVRVCNKIGFEKIERNLDDVISAAKLYMDNDKQAMEVSYQRLVSEKLLRPIHSVKGEKYDGINVKKGGGTIKLNFPDGSALERVY